MLAQRLSRHGLAVTGVSLTALLSHQAAIAHVPSHVLTSTITAMGLAAAGNAASTVSAKVLLLAEGVVKGAVPN